MSQSANEIMDLERGFWESGSHPEYFQSTMLDSAISVMEPMGFLSKQTAVDAAKQGEDWTEVKMQDVKLVELTPDCIAVAYHGEGKGSKSGKAYKGSVNSVYVRQDGKWKLGMTSHQPWDPSASQ